LNPDRVTLIERSSAIEQGAADEVGRFDDEWLAGPRDSQQIAVNAGDVGIRGKHIDLLFELVALPSIVRNPEMQLRRLGFLKNRCCVHSPSAIVRKPDIFEASVFDVAYDGRSMAGRTIVNDYETPGRDLT
jgi:hypothetical protein